MARKGGQSKSGPNLASPNRQNTTNGDILNTPERDPVHGEDPSSHLQGKSNGSGGNTGQKTKSNKKNNKSNGTSFGKSDDITSHKQQPEDISTDMQNSEEPGPPFSSTRPRRDGKKSSRRGFGKNSSVEQTPLRILTEQVKEKTRHVTSMAASFFRTSMMYVMEESKVLVEKNRPAITAFMAMAEKGRAYALGKMEYVYPIARAWMFSAGKLMLLLLTVWLDCNIRGFDSLLRLGTNSLIAVLWCSMLSIFAMIGIKKMLGDCCFCGCFYWYWFCCPDCRGACSGDFMAVWKLLDNKHCSNCWSASFLLKHERFALLVTCLYSMYCARSYIGWLGLLLSLNLSFFSTDVLVQFLKKNVDNENGSSRNSDQNSDRSSNFFGEFQQSSKDSSSHSGYTQPSNRGPGDPSTSGAEELTSEDEVARLLNCADHYSAFGFRLYEIIDVSVLKREYKKNYVSPS
ncbi:unnamed protein product [Triticum turgidum subsp. durum]|uniref:Uncharacterized protein n=1 Tax=Triticum turgidum subsp. durum TaxID=4567 RepID=A0A9R0XN92_TRITD|nr:unnamed protein product [Triticum turgidum subsp. durum]